MLTLTYGLKKPENGDTEATIYGALADNITQLDGHSHNGTNSPRLTASTQTINSASWSSAGNGLYSQTVTLAAGLSYDSIAIEFRLSNGTKINPSVARVSSSQYTVTINDNTQTLTAIYTH